MFAIKFLVKRVIKTEKSPEELLKVKPVQATPENFSSFVRNLKDDDACNKAVHHFHEVIRYLVSTQGFDCANLAGRFFALTQKEIDEKKLLQEAKELEKNSKGMPEFNWMENIEGMPEIKALWHYGISLSWALFEWGEPEWKKVYDHSALPMNMSYPDYMNTLHNVQGADNFERQWWIGPGLDPTRLHICLMRMLSILPKIVVHPSMPEFSEVYDKIYSLIKDVDIDRITDPLTIKVAKRLKKKKQLCCLFFFATPAMIIRWCNGVPPRLIIRRYCFLLMRLFEMYGDIKTLEFLVASLDQTAKIFTFDNFYQVIEEETWTKRETNLQWRNIHFRKKSQQNGMLTKQTQESPDSDSGNSQTD